VLAAGKITASSIVSITRLVRFWVVRFHLHPDSDPSVYLVFLDHPGAIVRPDGWCQAA